MTRADRVVVAAVEGNGESMSGRRASGAMPEKIGRAAELALDRKARDVVAMDLRGISSATDFFVIATGSSDIQVKAIAERISEGLREEYDEKPDHVEGLETARWVLLDYIDFVVHVFHPQARDYYQIETLWGDAPSVAFDDDAESASPAASGGGADA